MKAYLYLRTSGDDGRDKAGLPLQRRSCYEFAERVGYKIVDEFVDDGITGKLPMHARRQGRLLISALLGDGIKMVICYDAKRIGRTQPTFWAFVGLCRDNRIKIIDASGTDLTGSVMGGVNGMLAEMDRDATVARLSAGKAHWRGKKRVDGRWPFGEHPSHEYDQEREIVDRIKTMKLSGRSSYSIAKRLNCDGTRTRYGKVFTTRGIQNILARV